MKHPKADQSFNNHSEASMKNSSTLRSAFITALMTAAVGASAHDGHGLAGTHWHATDTLGFVLVGVLALAAVWFSRK